MADPVLRFEYPGVDNDDGRGDPGRRHFYLFKTDRAVSEVQIFDKGAKNNLHFHGAEDGVWIVLGGKATFYGEGKSGEGDAVMAQLEPFQGLLIPAGTKYWFESAGDEPLQILRVDYRVRPEAESPTGASGFQVLDSYGSSRWSAYADEQHETVVARRGR